MLLHADSLFKSFGGVHALRGASLRLAAGEVLALVGENGAGKSTLMKALAGVHQPDSGSIKIDGRPVRLTSVKAAQKLGVHLIHQELNLCENLSVAANLFLGQERSVLGVLRDGAMRRETAAILARVGLRVPPDTLVAKLSPGQRQLVEIARSLAQAARVIIMDEPTSSLSAHDTERLFAVVDDLKRQGVAVVYVSHRLAEVERLADRATVLRDGQNAGDLPRAAITRDALVTKMVGRELAQLFPRSPGRQAGRPMLEIKNVRYAGGPTAQASLTVHAGEIVGVAGLVGAGRTELAEAVFGLRKVTHGEVRVAERPARIASPAAAIRRGVLLVPEDRRHHGLILDEPIRWNLSLPNLRKLSLLGWLRAFRERKLALRAQERLRIKAASLALPVGTLSGGNQQKVVLGKWLDRNPRVLICDEPTRGVDVGAKAEIYAVLDRLAEQGAAVLMISSDLEEVIGMSDRVVVMHEGRVAGELPRARLTEEAIMHLATGGGTRP